MQKVPNEEGQGPGGERWSGGSGNKTQSKTTRKWNDEEKQRHLSVEKIRLVG